MYSVFKVPEFNQKLDKIESSFCYILWITQKDTVCPMESQIKIIAIYTGTIN